MRFRRELLKGCLRTLILRVLADQPSYANKIRRILDEQSAGAFQIPEGTIYSVLHRLEDKGLIASEPREDGMKVYRLTGEGKRELEYSLREWRMFSRAMDVALGGK